MLPFFYHPPLTEQQQVFTLDEPTSKHCIQVLRMEEGEEMLLTNGLGQRSRARIVAADRKRCGVQLIHTEQLAPRLCTLSLAIAFTKNNSRNEWLLEKATEAGIEHIYPLVSARTEKDKFNAERLKGILVSAMLQSQQCYLPVLHEPAALKKIVTMPQQGQRLIAHCIDTEARKGLMANLQPGSNVLALVGPEGDFTPEEVTLCLDHGFQAISLGEHRLRTETAGLYVCMVFNALNYA